MPILGSLIKKAYELRQFPIDLRNINPKKAQDNQLKKLLIAAQHTAFGEHYHFNEILNQKNFVEAFRKSVPVHDYHSIFSSWWYRMLQGETYVAWPGKVKYFALTSGTSESSSKHIPVSFEMLHSIRKATIRLLVSTTKYNFPTEFYSKGILMIGGSTHLQYNGTYYQGDLSGITANDIPFWFQHFYKPGRRISKEKEWSVKLNEIVRQAKNWDIGVVVGVPAWIQIILEKIVAYYKISNIHDIWPNLMAYVHSGVSFEPYIKSFESLMGRPIVYNESYLASEGYFAYQKPWSKNAMEMILDNKIFYEFIPFHNANFDSEGNLKTNPQSFTIDQIEEGKEYALIISNCSGAWRYLIGDTLKFTSKERSEIMLTGRTKQFLNLCGEHLSQDNITRAIKMLQDEFNINVNEFTVTGIPYRSLFAHQWYLGTDCSLDPDLIAQKLDSYLKFLNDDYRVERIEAIQIVLVEILPLSLFYSWMKQRGKEGGAHKFPRVLKGESLKQWEDFVAKNKPKS